MNCLGHQPYSWDAHVQEILRQAIGQDIPGMHRVRLAVRENRLTSSKITQEHYIAQIETTGRGWVLEVGGVIVAFAVGNAQTGNIWALFVDPDHERLGYGRRLHDVMVGYLFDGGLERLFLSTGSGTRAMGFYEAAGWQHVPGHADGDVHYELLK